MKIKKRFIPLVLCTGVGSTKRTTMSSVLDEAWKTIFSANLEKIKCSLKYLVEATAGERGVLIYGNRLIFLDTNCPG